MTRSPSPERRSYLSALLDKLREEHDHLKVQFELGKMEARDEWHQLEKKWQHLESRAEQLEDDVEDTFEDLADELKARYRRLRDRLKD